MRLAIVLLSLLVIVGCSRDISDLHQFVANIKAQPAGKISLITAPPELPLFDYHGESFRNPFVPPRRELTEEVIDTSRDCLQPDLNRLKQPLESYALDNLTMRGSLQEDELVWGLVQTIDEQVFRLGIGDYLGLYHGRITQISTSQINIIELIPDGSGCWTERLSSIELSNGKSAKE